MRPHHHTIFAVVTAIIFLFEFTTCFENTAQETVSSAKKPSKGLQILPDAPFGGSNLEVRCGETYNTSTGSVFYKPFTEILDNERCVWIIGVPGAVGYNIELQYLGSPTNQQGSGQELVLTGVQHRNALSPVLTAYRPESTGSFVVSDAHIIIVSFHSSAQNGNPSTGFTFRYEGILQGNISGSSENSTHHLLDQTTYEWKFPVGRTNFDAGELSAIVFSPQDNFYTGSVNHGWYKKSGISSDCYDGVFMYEFIKGSTEEVMAWQQVNRICSDTNELHFTFDDMVLLILESGRSSGSTRSGFWLTSVSCQCT